MNCQKNLPPFPLWENAVRKVRRFSPVVHCITNYVTAGWCADALLAAGAAPIMADEPEEMDDITSIAGSLVLNIGTLRQTSLVSMRRAAETANRLNKPVLLDPVGAGASRLRTESALSLLNGFHPAVVRGNISEILALAGCTAESRGVDADPAALVHPDRMTESAEWAAQLARRWRCVVAVSGPVDIISDGRHTCAVGGGDPMMARITGCGCMLSALCGAFLAEETDPWNAVSACFAMMCLCGGYAAQSVRAAGGGTASFRIRLLDALSLFSPERLAGAAVQIL